MKAAPKKETFGTAVAEPEDNTVCTWRAGGSREEWLLDWLDDHDSWWYRTRVRDGGRS